MFKEEKPTKRLKASPDSDTPIHANDELLVFKKEKSTKWFKA